MFVFGRRSSLLALLFLTVCPCKICLGLDNNYVRQTVHNHKRKYGIATEQEIARARNIRYDGGGQDDNSDDNDDDGAGAGDVGLGDDDGLLGADLGAELGNMNEDENPRGPDDESIDWNEDPFFNRVRPYVTELVGGE